MGKEVWVVLDWASLLNAKALQKLKSLQLNEQAEKLLFADLKDAKLRKAMNDEPSLLEGWKLIHQSTLRQNPKVLKQINNLVSKGLDAKQIKKLSDINDTKAFDIANNLASRNVFKDYCVEVAEQAFSIVKRPDINYSNIVEDISELARNKNFESPNVLKKVTTKLNQTDWDKGAKLQLKGSKSESS